MPIGPALGLALEPGIGLAIGLGVGLAIGLGIGLTIGLGVGLAVGWAAGLELGMYCSAIPAISPMAATMRTATMAMTGSITFGTALWPEPLALVALETRAVPLEEEFVFRGGEGFCGLCKLFGLFTVSA